MYLEVSNLKKSYGEGGSYAEVLKGVSVSVEKGVMCVIQGTSGSGKSTLLNCIGGLDLIDSGSIKVDGKEIFGLSQKKLSDYRRENLGFIFQFYNLVPNLTVKENIQVCEYLSDHSLDVDELMETLGLTEHQNKFPFRRAAAAETIVAGTADAAGEQAVLDGQFSVFAPLTNEEAKRIQDKGITIEEHFYMEYIAENHIVLRVFKVRQDIDRIRADAGSIPLR